MKWKNKKSFSYFLLFSTLVEEAKGGRERWGFILTTIVFETVWLRSPLCTFAISKSNFSSLSKVFGFCRHVLKCGWSYGLPSPWSPSWLTMRKDKLDHKVLTCHTQTLVTKREKKFLHPTLLRWDFNSIFFGQTSKVFFDYFGEEICRGDWQPSKIVFDKFR